MTIPQKISKPFIDAFDNNITKYTQNNNHIQQKIKDIKDSGVGIFTRFLDQMVFDETIAEDAYNVISSLPDEQAIHQHMQETIEALSKHMFNESMTDFNDKIKESMGNDYNDLVNAYKNELKNKSEDEVKIIMVNHILNAMVVLYAQVITNAATTKIAQDPNFDVMKFNEEISIPINNFNTKLNNDELSKSLMLLHAKLESINTVLNNELNSNSIKNKKGIEEVQKVIKESSASINNSLANKNILNMASLVFNKITQDVEASVHKNIQNTSLKERILNFLLRALTFGAYDYKSEKTQQKEVVVNTVMKTLKDQLQLFKQEQRQEQAEEATMVNEEESDNKFTPNMNS